MQRTIYCRAHEEYGYDIYCHENRYICYQQTHLVPEFLVLNLSFGTFISDKCEIEFIKIEQLVSVLDAAAADCV